MSFAVDQFMQVKCKLVLTSDIEADSIQLIENERIRLCTSINDKTATLIVMVCSNHASNNNILTYYVEKRTNRISKPRIKQIFYHHYNEDIVALALSESGNKLAIINSSSTIYLLPIKNILLRSFQCKSMYFYDATILNCCSIENPAAIVYWESTNTSKSTIIVAGEQGKISFISVEDKKEFDATFVNDTIINLQLIKDMCSHSLLISCNNYKQYRYTLEMFELPENQKQQLFPNNDYNYIEKDPLSMRDRKPIPIKLQSSNIGANGSTAAALHRVLVPSGRGVSSNHTVNLFAGRERSIPSIFYHSTVNMISIVDILGAQKQKVSSNQRVNTAAAAANNNNDQVPEGRLLRFFSSKQFYYRPQKPTLVSKLNSLEPDEKITHLVLTDRFLAIATDSNRCLINSRNCCNSKNVNSTIELDPLIKEIDFYNDEKILTLLKSPVTNDQDIIVDSFILVTSKSIYSIEARQSCRDMYINLIDSHLGIKPPRTIKSFNSENLVSTASNPNEYILVDDYRAQRKYSESNLMVSNFLCHRDEVYERINYDSKAFSILFKLELNSLYEAYGDKLMLRNQFDLANRFFQMAKFDHTRTLGKYIRLGAFRESVEYVRNLLNDENEILDEKERIDLARAAFDCLLAKTIIERSKTILYYNKISRIKLKFLMEEMERRKAELEKSVSPSKSCDESILSRKSNQVIATNYVDLYRLCEHSPRGNTAKLSGNTIIGEDDDEATMTNEENRLNKVPDKRLECEKALVMFVKKLLPSSLYSYAMTQFVDFGLIDIADHVARLDTRLHTLTRIVLKSKEENRALFRDARFESLIEKLEQDNNYRDLIRIDGCELKFLEFITSLEVTRALVKDINLTSEYLGYQKTPVQFRKYSYTALRQLESFRKFVDCQRMMATGKEESLFNGISHKTDKSLTAKSSFTRQQRRSMEDIFLEFLRASLDESTEDSCKSWYNYINFYLNYVSSVDELQIDILNLLNPRENGNVGDCRFAITLYKAIGRDEAGSSRLFINEGITNTPLESMEKLYNLSEIFDAEFLIKLLEKTLDTIPQSWYQVNNFSHMLVIQ